MSAKKGKAQSPAPGNVPAAKVVETPVEIPTPITRTVIQPGSEEFRALNSNMELMMQFLGSLSSRIDATEAARVEAQEVALGEIQELRNRVEMDRSPSTEDRPDPKLV